MKMMKGKSVCSLSNLLSDKDGVIEREKSEMVAR
jgi:hypothetical protein